MTPPIRQFASVDHVKNVFLFVADSVRERSTSEEVTRLGASGRAIAPSTWTASSFPSILSGNYPTTHRVWSFDDRLADRPGLLDGPETFGMDARTIWTDLPPSEKPPFNMIGATEADAAPLGDLTPPFVAVEHHKGGHMPYGYPFSEYTSPEFWKRERPTLEKLQPLYEESVRTAEDRFLEAVSGLRERDLLEETLVIYTSDHGEALCESDNRGSISHGDPITPDLVNVPIVFAGAGLPDRELDALVSGTDIAPTLLSALGRGGEQRTDGRDCWARSTNERSLRSEYWRQFDAPVIGTIDRYKATSVWDRNGGFVFHEGNPLVRTALGIGAECIKAPYSYLYRSPRGVSLGASLAKTYGTGTIQYGDPDFDRPEGREQICAFRESDAGGNEVIDREQLRNLGYLE